MPPPHASASTRAPGAEGEPLPVDLATGRATLPSGGRVALLSDDVIRELHFAILEAHPDSAQDVLYRSGYEWALRSMVGFTTGRTSAANANAEPTPTDATGWLVAWWRSCQDAGWGAMRVQPGVGGTALIELPRGAVADSLGRADDPVCHLYAGLFAGALSFLDRGERHAVEISCRAAGHQTCRFIVGPAADIDRVETWRQQGVAPEELAQRVMAAGAASPVVSSEPKTTGRGDGASRTLVGATADMLRSLQFVLEKERPGSWTAVLKATGRSCGLRLASENDAELVGAGRPALAAQPLAAALQPLESCFREYGWGVLAIDASGADDFGLIVGSLTGSVFAELLDDSATFADPLPAGMLQGYVEHMTGQTLACDEIACGHGSTESCVFALSTPDRIAVVAPFIGRESGPQIIARLRS